jgi:hypothetical protein
VKYFSKISNTCFPNYGNIDLKGCEGMQDTGFIIVLPILGLIVLTLIILIAIIRYAIDSSKTSRKFDNLLFEVQMLRKELNMLNNKKHIIDKRI